MKIKSKRFIILSLSLLLALGIVSPVQAQGILQGNTVPEGTFIANDVVLVGEDVVLAGEVDGNVFILGSRAVVTGKVSGSLLALGGNLALDGEVGGTLYAGGLTLEVGPHARLGRDLYAVAVSLVLQAGSLVERDLFALGLDAGLSGQVGRSLHTVIGPIQLYNGLMRLLGFEDLVISLNLIPQPPAPSLPAPQAAPTPGPSGWLAPGGVAQVFLASAPQRYAGVFLPDALLPGLGALESPFDWGAWALRLLRDWAALFLFGLLALWLLRRPLESAGQPPRQHPWRTLGVGLLVLVIGVHLFWVALLLSVLIFVLGLGIGFLDLWALSLVFMLASYAVLVLLVVALWLFIVYGTKLIVAWCFGAWAFEKLMPGLARFRVLPLLLGTVAYALLRSIPTAGWVVGVLVTAAGMGAAWLAWRSRRTPAPASPPPAFEGPRG